MRLHFLSSLRIARIENCCMGELEVILKSWLWPCMNTSLVTALYQDIGSISLSNKLQDDLDAAVWGPHTLRSACQLWYSVA